VWQLAVAPSAQITACFIVAQRLQTKCVFTLGCSQLSLRTIQRTKLTSGSSIRNACWQAYYSWTPRSPDLITTWIFALGLTKPRVKGNKCINVRRIKINGVYQIRDVRCSDIFSAALMIQFVFMTSILYAFSTRISPGVVPDATYSFPLWDFRFPHILIWKLQCF
jgi:hypothetical protein